MNPEEIARDLRRMAEHVSTRGSAFPCRRCKVMYLPTEEWIFYDLCADCFRLYDAQKLTGIHSCDEWLAKAAKGGLGASQ